MNILYTQTWGLIHSNTCSLVASWQSPTCTSESGHMSFWRLHCRERNRKGWWWSWCSRGSRQCPRLSVEWSPHVQHQGWPSWQRAHCRGSTWWERPGGWTTVSLLLFAPASFPEMPSWFYFSVARNSELHLPLGYFSDIVLERSG